MKWIFFSLVALRLIIGFHFFTEGKKKLDQGNWNAAPFFSAAHGPFAPYFKLMLPDADRLTTLCVSEEEIADENQPTGEAVKARKVSNTSKQTVALLDPSKTFGFWELFLEDVLVGYKLSQKEIASRIDSLSREIDDLEKAIAKVASDQPDAAGLLKTKQERLNSLRGRLQKADPLQDMLKIVQRRKQQLTNYLTFPVHKSEILKSVDDEKRLRGFIRDGENRQNAAVYVESLRDQVDSIESGIKSIRYKHSSEIEGIWNGLEEELNEYGSSLQSPLESSLSMETKVKLDKPFAINKNTALFWINLIIPYFDFTVGILLLIGLFSRVASLAAAGFLLGIILTQPIWVPGYDAKIIYQIVEFGGLLVLAATVAGRFGGLDYFVWRLLTPTVRTNTDDADLE